MAHEARGTQKHVLLSFGHLTLSFAVAVRRCATMPAVIHAAWVHGSVSLAVSFSPRRDCILKREN